ncbi:MAG TPA: hypothetical protein DCS88_03385, partial [Alphaproteobacteria bacterium]|nr:hypothetical protein [Alphaproteobacteria bacterium]
MHQRGLDSKQRRKTVNWRDYISTDPNICHGQACIRGT